MTADDAGRVGRWSPPEGYRMVLNPLTGRYADGFDRTKTYRFMRAEWDSPSAFKMADAHPAFNIAGLYYIDLPASIRP